MSSPPHSDLITLTIFGEEYRLWSSSWRSFLHDPSSSLSGPNILNTLFSQSLGASLQVRDQVSHPYSTTGKITVLCILIFRFMYLGKLFCIFPSSAFWKSDWMIRIFKHGDKKRTHNLFCSWFRHGPHLYALVLFSETVKNDLLHSVNPVYSHRLYLTA